MTLGKALVLLALVGGLSLSANRAAAAQPDSRLQQRLNSWPDWQLPAPLPRPGREDLLYPDWFLGNWQVNASDGESYGVRFIASPAGVVGDRAFNAAAVGAAVLGDQLQSVANDPTNPNRQIARLRLPSGDQLELESTVVGRRRENNSSDDLLVDELALQVMHGGGDVAVSRVETLSRFHRLEPDRIAATQWQATYPSPAEGLRVRARSTNQLSLTLQRVESPADRAS